MAGSASASALGAARARRLVEPFCGGLAVALGLKPAAALLNDANPHLVNFYRWLQRGSADSRCRWRTTKVCSIAIAIGSTSYCAARAGRERRGGGALLLSQSHGDSTACADSTAQGLFNVPFGRYARIRYTRDFSPYRERSPGGRLRAATSKRCRSGPGTSSTRIRPTTCSSRTMRAAASPGAIRSEPPACSPRTTGR